MVDDSHAVGFMGAHGKGTPEHCGVMDRIDIITGTFGKALGGASGGYTAARQPIVDLLRQRSRPYLFSNTVAPAICAATIRTIELLEESTALRDKVHENARYFRAGMEKLGFELLPGEHSTRKAFITGDTILNRFRKAHNLTYEELGVMLSNSTRQNAFNLCRRDGISDTMLQRLCEFEGISAAEFLERYGEGASA
jgi:glycine C-acetyltransferase